MPLVFIPSVIFPFVFSKLIIFQVLIGVTFPAYLCLVWMDPTYRLQKHWLMTAIFSYFVAIACSVAFAIDPMRAWWGNQERMNGLFTLLHFLAWIVMTVSLLKTWDDWKRLLNFQVMVGAVVAMTAVWQKWVNPDVFLFHAEGRVGGILDNPIYMGVYQMFMFFFLVLLWLKNRVTVWRIFYAIFAVIGIFAFIAAQSRGPLLGIFAGLVVFALYVGFFSKNKRIRWSVTAVVAISVLGYGGLYLAKDTQIVAKLGLSRFVNLNTTVDTRLIAWQIAWSGFKEHPVFGYGFDNFHILFNQKYNPISLRYSLYETWFDRAHNTVLDVLSMTGIVGFLTFMSIFLAIFLVTYRAYKRGWIDLPLAAMLFALPVAYFVQNLFVFDHPAGFSLSFLLYGLIVAATRPGFLPASESDLTPIQGKKRDFSWAMGIGLFLVTGILVWRTSVLPFRVSQMAIASGQLFGNQATNAQALALAQQAATIWTPYVDEQAFLLSRNIVSLASTNAFSKLPNWRAWYALADERSQTELARHPLNTYTHYIYARLLNETMGDIPENREKTEVEYKAAIATSQKRQQLYQGLARFYTEIGRVDDGLKQLEIARDFDKDDGYGFWLHGVSLMYDKNQKMAGAQEVVSGLDKPFPYRLSSARDFVPLFDALQTVGQKDRMDSFLPMIPYDQTVDQRVYAQIAYQLHLAGRTNAENQVIEAASAVYPTVRELYQKGLSSMTTTSPTTIKGKEIKK